jgi:hypothetical protein
VVIRRSVGLLAGMVGSGAAHGRAPDRPVQHGERIGVVNAAKGRFTSGTARVAADARDHITQGRSANDECDPATRAEMLAVLDQAGDQLKLG